MIGRHGVEAIRHIWLPNGRNANERNMVTPLCQLSKRVIRAHVHQGNESNCDPCLFRFARIAKDVETLTEKTEE